ncbi:hypothetical protein DFR50_109110 [Roseiarcus fermentans]|uniref:Uncharacterized protein n=1 Tax=Roseiarcus fermentans TaxID=1473586 RepID=A0A366FIE9_9HYPH|nr:hypothetical protein [Roseiarcus fermentans]RBP14357.1 hypothetical protein DFR50_109110 [Roseiarcus fermentans]
MSDRYAIERVNDRRWVVIDTARRGPPIGGSASESGARNIVSLLGAMRPATPRGDARTLPDPRRA